MSSLIDTFYLHAFWVLTSVHLSFLLKCFFIILVIIIVVLVVLVVQVVIVVLLVCDHYTSCIDYDD